MTTFFTFSEGDITNIIGYMTDIFTDFSPVILLIVGVAIAMLVIGFIIKVFTR